MNHLRAALIGASVLAFGFASQAMAQPAPTDEPTSDAGRPSGLLIPPGTVTPMSGNGVTPLGANYLGAAPDPTKRGFQNPPGHLPRPDPTRSDLSRSTSVTTSVPMTLPPAATGRQGLPPQTWALLSARQQQLHHDAEAGALGSALGQGYEWSDNGRRGEVRVVGDRMFNNRPCRDFTHVVYIDGQRVDGTTTVCKP